MKYIVTVIDGQEAIFTFPRVVSHDRMAEALEIIRFGDGFHWERKLRQKTPENGALVSAGFVHDGVCQGASETLGLASRGQVDTILLQASR